MAKICRRLSDWLSPAVLSGEVHRFLSQTVAGSWACTLSSHGKIDKQTYQTEPWMLEIISYWSADKLSSIFLKSTKNCALKIQHKNHVLFIYHILESLLPCLRAPVCPQAPTCWHFHIPLTPTSLSSHIPMFVSSKSQSPSLCLTFSHSWQATGFTGR